MKFVRVGDILEVVPGKMKLRVENIVASDRYFFAPAALKGQSGDVISKSFAVLDNTSIKLKSEPRILNHGVSFDAVGGLEVQIRVVREMVELPLLKPEVFSQFGLKPPRGVLFYGPPGTGKTLIARAVASELDVHVVIINGAEIMSKYVGETEASLRQLFSEAAQQSPSIVFIDEIDALCPKRDDSVNETEKRVVATLLTLMDGLVSEKRIVVIGATNRPHALDQALRRAGRFDKEIEIGIPDAKARSEIFNVHLRGVPHTLTESELETISNSTHGYVGADIAALCREASMIALDRSLNTETKSYVSYDDFIRAKSQVRASAMREITLEIPKVHWSDIGGQENVKRKLIESIQWPLQHPEAFRKLGISAPRGVLLYGPPGCSKTLMARAVATESGLNFFAIKGPELFSKWVGESERAIKELFRKARAASPSIIFFDEIDAIANQRSGMGGGNGSSGVSDRVLTQLLTEMDGIEPLSNVIVIAATNRPDIIDPALVRPGRLDRLLYITPPDLEARRSIFEIRLKQTPIAADISLDDLAQRSSGMSGAEIVALCQEAALAAIHEFRDSDVPLDEMTVTLEHFDQAFRDVKPRITQEMITYYEDFAKK